MLKYVAQSRSIAGNDHSKNKEKPETVSAVSGFCRFWRRPYRMGVTSVTTR